MEKRRREKTHSKITRFTRWPVVSVMFLWSLLYKKWCGTSWRLPADDTHFCHLYTINTRQSAPAPYTDILKQNGDPPRIC